MTINIVNFYLGDNENDAVNCCQFELDIIPRIGDKFEFYSTRDDNGNYVHKYAGEKFAGIVDRVEHLLEEKGSDSKSWRLLHYINIFLKPIKKDNE